MKYQKQISFIVLLLLFSNFNSGFAQQKDYPIAGVPFTSVKFTDNFWLPRIHTNHDVTIPASFARCESTGRLKNFEMAAARKGKFCTIYPFDDTDIYKTIEGASFSLSLIPDKKMETYIDSLIDLVGKAQEPDGYLYTARTIDPSQPHSWSGKNRWEKERDNSHELYNSGHLFEAAAAHYQATGKKNLLNFALKNADLVCSVFGPGRVRVAPGHQVVEMGLVKLYRITGKREYLETAKFFIEARGHFNGYDSASSDPWKNGAYWQDHKPVVDQDEAVGHAVRAGYLYSGMADVAALTGDGKFLSAIDKLWINVVEKKLYVQGSIGAVGSGERFGEDYELPNSTAYNETCAAIANVYWNQRMFQLHGESKYIDILEKSLYNGLISGVGMDGESFFYTNAMEIKNSFTHKDMEAERSGWFPCSCCPTNVTRLIPSVPGYVYAVRDDALYVNLFVKSNSTVSVNNKEVQIIQENDYPWDGDLVFKVNPKSAMAFKMLLRIPGWARGKAVPSDLYSFSEPTTSKVSVLVNGKAFEYPTEKGYAVLSRTWKKGDVIQLRLPMSVQRVLSSEKVANNIGKVALQRGPIMYCVEWPDNFGLISNLVVPRETKFTPEFRPDMLNGVTVLRGDVTAVVVDSSRNTVTSRSQTLTAIPYYAWAHRGKGEMAIWLPEKIVAIEILAR